MQPTVYCVIILCSLFFWIMITKTTTDNGGGGGVGGRTRLGKGRGRGRNRRHTKILRVTSITIKTKLTAYGGGLGVGG